MNTVDSEERTQSQSCYLGLSVAPREQPLQMEASTPMDSSPCLVVFRDNPMPGKGKGGGEGRRDTAGRWQVPGR